MYLFVLFRLVLYLKNMRLIFNIKMEMSQVCSAVTRNQHSNLYACTLRLALALPCLSLLACSLPCACQLFLAGVMRIGDLLDRSGIWIGSWLFNTFAPQTRLPRTSPLPLARLSPQNNYRKQANNEDGVSFPFCSFAAPHINPLYPGKTNTL